MPGRLRRRSRPAQRRRRRRPVAAPGRAGRAASCPGTQPSASCAMAKAWRRRGPVGTSRRVRRRSWPWRPPRGERRDLRGRRSPQLTIDMRSNAGVQDVSCDGRGRALVGGGAPQRKYGRRPRCSRASDWSSLHSRRRIVVVRAIGESDRFRGGRAQFRRRSARGDGVSRPCCRPGGMARAHNAPRPPKRGVLG